MRSIICILSVAAVTLGVACDEPGDDQTDGDTANSADTEVSFADSQSPTDTAGSLDSATAADTTQPPADTTQPPADTTQPPADTTQPPADTTQPPADTTLPPADTTQPPADTTQPPADTTQPPDTTIPPGVDMNPGWVGGACASASDCDSGDYTAAASCIQTDFPNGFCTQPCSQGATAWLCPDTDYGTGTDNTITRCVTTAAGQDTCAAECDFTISPTGCRGGYACVLRSRHGQPHRIYPICLPEADQGWPGEPALSDDIGAACVADEGCESLRCLSLPGGYCTKTMCEWTGCPSGSTCYTFDNSDVASCLKDCSGDASCRADEGYVCDDFDSCWPDPTSTGWNSAVGVTDCASAWGTGGSGLSPCDSTKDHYVVVNKTARNLAMCDAGVNVNNFWIGLGFTPSGDKQIEGDGKTPDGVFYVARLVPNSSFYKAWLLSYPDAGDASWGLSQGIVTQAQKAQIDSAQAGCTEPPQQTGLGGLIELHGNGGKQDWTWGCVAMEDAEVDIMWGWLGVRDTIIVKP
ncbi:MAG: hypothetical protein ACI9MR_003797 [Myxococcota bacterium]|jgi:hypothetical protein